MKMIPNEDAGFLRDMFDPVAQRFDLMGPANWCTIDYSSMKRRRRSQRREWRL